MSSAALEGIYQSPAEADLQVIDALYKRILPQDLWKYRKLRRRPGRELALFISETTSGRVSVEGWSLPLAIPKRRRSSVAAATGGEAA